ncbi:MAG TPA: bifunctional UDP-sugar hydrolase/5'-nucleotidase [Candidatus Methylacidiphilales bacterium]|nr:bifunctional UDP-sugar hydrolase/5'-nucleotidase [Candidatus Methylacidiphilales bacterium]
MEIFAPTLSRRRFLRLLGQGTLLAALPAPLRADDANIVTISILHTTDLHGHILPTTDYAGHADLGGLARCASQIRQWRRDNPHALLLDIGDVYQGTELGLRTRGATMIRCLNALGYDAWVVGNHEFDWGMDPFTSCVGASEMPVLSGNARVEGKPLGLATGPLAKIRPWLIKEIAGIRLAVISATTPALTTWLPPENLAGFETLDPVEALRPLLKEIAGAKPDAILLAGHMGLTRLDDIANRVGALTREFPQLAVCLGGHTHQNHPSLVVNNVLYTQADHFGIYAGRVDLTFDRASRKLLHRAAVTVPMDHQVPLDPLVLSLAHDDLDAAGRILAQPIGELTETFGLASSFGRPSDVERLIASGMIAALRKKGVEADAVVHGLFDREHPLAPGAKTVADAWTVLPYENQIVTVDLAYADLLALAQELGASLEPRNLMGLRVAGAATGKTFRVDALLAADGSPLVPKPAYRIALNAYDSQSAGQRFPTLGRLVAQPSNRRMLHPIQTRDALIDFFVSRRKISRVSLLV